MAGWVSDDKYYEEKMIEITSQDHVAVLRMSRGKVNAMSLEFCQRLISALDEVAQSDAIAAVIVGNGRVFSAGVDLRELVDRDQAHLEQYLPLLKQTFKTAFQFPKPLVAAIDGPAIAGGCVLASTCDLRLIHHRAQIGLPELRIGVPLPSAAIEIMRFAVAPEALRTMVNVGKTYFGEEAVRVGLADCVVEQQAMLDEAVQAAIGLTVVPPNVFHLSKQQQRAPAMRNIAANESEFGQRVDDIWFSAENQQIVADYVRERL